jgi:hypothetical protein
MVLPVCLNSINNICMPTLNDATDQLALDIDFR